MARVVIKQEVPKRLGNENDWTLHFQKVTYHFDDGETKDGFRFIWRRPDGSLQAARGQALIPDGQNLYHLIDLAVAAGILKKDDL